MKLSIALILAVGLFGNVSAQQAYSYYGLRHTLKDTLQIMFLYVGFLESNSSDDITGWAHSDIPDWAKGDYNALIDTDVDSIGERLNLTHYYHSMSQGKFVVIGDIFPELIRVHLRRDTIVTPDTINGGYDTSYNISNSQYASMTSDAFDSINARIARSESPYISWDWSQYDRRQNKSSYGFDNSLYSDVTGTPAGPDGVIDHITIIFRELEGIPGGYASSNLSEPIYTNADTFNTGLHIFHRRAYKDPLPFNSWWHHEFAHNIFNCAHFFNNNNTCGNRWYAKQGWGFMGGGESPFETVLGWEAWWLGWLEPTTIFSDTTITIGDFVIQGEALRIAMPHTDGNHYLWIENHQMIDSFESPPPTTP